MINIKKYFKTFIITCFLFVCFITTAKADSSFEIPRQGDYNNLNCDAAIAKLQNFNVATTVYKYTFTPKGNIDGKVTEKITCSYSGGGYKVGSSSSGKVTFELTASAASSGKMEYNISFTGTVEDKYDLIQAFHATSLTITNYNSGSNYVKVTGCNGTSQCYFNPIETNDGNTSHTVSFDFKYTAGGKEYDATANMTVTYIGNIAAHPGAMGTCTMPASDWSDGKLGSTWVDMSGTERLASFYLSKKNTNVKFGTCEPKDKNLVKFVGWAPASSQRAFNSGTGQLVGVCSSLEGLVKPNTTVAKPAKYYSACYEYVPSVKLTGLRGGKLTGSTSGWTSNGTDSYINKSSGKVTLPNVSYEAYNKANGTSYTFVGWSAGGLNVVQAGTQVDADGTTYTPVINRTETDINYFKNVYLDETFNLQVGNATGCSLGSGASTFVSASFSGGVCKVKGVKITGSNEFAPIVIKKSDGTTVTYKFKVLSKVGVSGYVYDENNIPIIQPGVVAGKNDTYTTAHGDGTGEMITDNKCNTYSVTSLGESDVWNNDEKDPMRSGVFDVKCKNGTQLEDVIALCLDPGIMGPGDNDDVTYVKSFDVAAGSDFAKLLDFLSKRITEKNVDMKKPNNPNRIAYHIAVRIVGLKYFDNGYTSALSKHYEKYKAAADALPKKGKIDNAESIISPLGIKKDDIKKELIYVLENYRTDETNEKSTNEQFSNIVSSVYKEVTGSDSYTLTYKGKFTLPKGSKNIQISNGCGGNNNGYSCAVVSHKVLSEPDEFGRVVVEYEIKLTIGSAKNVEPITSSKGSAKAKKSLLITWSGNTAAQVSILQPSQSDGASFQRMVSVDPSPDKVYLYLPPGTGNAPDMCKGTISLNADNCTSDSDCPDNKFNESLFTASGCCAFVENEESYVAKSLCKGTCVESTMQSTCQFRPFGDTSKVDVYEIKEGAVLSGGHLNNSIGTCIVNIGAINYENADESQFEKVDSAGNSIMISEYNENKYCRVSCKEDFTVTLGAFGNYVGSSKDGKKGAVAAGTFFNLDDDIYMGGKRSCYTTFIDYNLYLNDIAELSDKIAKGYNKAFENSLIYTDLDKNQDATVSEDIKQYCKDEISKCKCGNAGAGKDYVLDSDGNKQYDSNGNAKTEACKCTGTAVEGYDATVSYGSSYCAGSGNSFNAYYYDINTLGNAEKYGSTRWSADLYSEQYSATKGTSSGNYTAASPSSKGDGYSGGDDNVYGCSASHGNGSTPSECVKQNDFQDVYDKYGAPLAEDYASESGKGRSILK